MIKKTLRKIYLLPLFLLWLIWANGQKPVNYDSPNYEFNTAMELFQKEKYGSAQQYFKYVFENTSDKQQDIKSNSYFYMGVCAAQLYNDDAIFLLRDFIRLYPVHSLNQEAYFYLGRYYFYKKKWKRVITSFEEIDTWTIPEEKQPEFYFKRGYSYFETDDFEEAKSDLYKAEGYEGEYQDKSTYYVAHIAYLEGNYEIAVQRFLDLKDSPEYKELIPFYVAQIYFLQEKYEELVEVAAPLYENTTGNNKVEMSRLLSLSYYRLGMYKKSESYFDYYFSHAKPPIDRKDYFAAGFSHFQTEACSLAIKYLSEVTKEKDILAQHAYYLIGDCYVKQQQLILAKQSFYEAYKFDFDAEVKEDALYNYAKLQYETSNQPFNNAIKSLEHYITEYPNSTRSEEASQYLSKIYLTSKNYQAAINSIERLSSKNPEMLKAYQRATYFRALEFVNNRDYRNAITLIEKSLKHPIDHDFTQNARYWKGEAEFRFGKFPEAYNTLKIFSRNEHKQDEFYVDANYTLGYASLKTKKYNDAITAFTNCINDQRNEDLNIKADATARLADSYFMKKNLKQAIKHYQACEKLGTSNADYAMYQRAKCYDYQGNGRKNLEVLTSMAARFPKSTYIDKVAYDIAAKQHNLGEYEKAITAYQDFIKQHPKSSRIRQAYNKLAQAYLNANNEEQAIATYKIVIEKFAGSQEAKDALTNLEHIYTQRGSTGDFVEYVKNKNVNYSEGRQDSISFKAAENKYVRGDCESAIVGFKDYIRQFPNGNFIATAHFYKAECEYGQNKYDDALVSYEIIINKYNTEYNETALRKTSYILFSKEDFARSKPYFKQLTEISSNDNNLTYGYNGLMRTSYELGLFQEALDAAKHLLNKPNIDNDLQQAALYFAGKSSLAMVEEAKAAVYFTELSHISNNDEGTEAAYWCAQIAFNQHDLANCEKLIKEVISGDYRSEYWLARTFILYGDWYNASGNSFQARHTYQSIIDNFDGEELRNLAQQKIDALGEEN